MRKAISVIGLGYIGLPLAISFADRGFQVVGVEQDMRKLMQLQLGISYVQEDYKGKSLTQRLQMHMQEGNFTATQRVAVAAWESTTYLVTVGIPVDNATGSLNAAPLTEAIAGLGRVMKPKDLVIIRSTVIPGMVESELIPTLERESHMVAGVDFHVAYAAERVAEGRAMEEFKTLDIVVGGLTSHCAQKAASVLNQLTEGTIHITNLRVAQLAKVIENVQRDVNLAIVNQMRSLADAHQVDLYELIRMVNTHPRVNLLMPSIGVGGYCIPNAYHYLDASVEANSLPLFQLARSINAKVPEEIVKSVERDLADAGKSLADATIAVFGLGMKDGSNDVRQSPAILCIEAFQRRGATVRAYDPTVFDAIAAKVNTVEACVRGADVIVVGAWQPDFEDINWATVIRNTKSPVIVVDPCHRIQEVFREWLNMSVVETI